MDFIQAYKSNNGNANVDTFSCTNVVAAIGDIILVGYDWRNVADVVTLKWNGEDFTVHGTPEDQGQCRFVWYILRTTTSGTHDVTGTFTNNTFSNAEVLVYRPLAGETISYSTPEFQSYLTGTYAAPSLLLSAVADYSTVIACLGQPAWDKDYNDMTATTWTVASPFTIIDSVVNTRQEVNKLMIATASTSGDTTATWTASGTDKPMYVHGIIAITATPSSLITVLENPIRNGKVTTLTTSPSLPKTSASLGGVAMIIGTGTVQYPAWSAGVADTLTVGTAYTFTCADGTNTFSASRTYNVPDNYTAVKMGSGGYTVDTGPQSLGSDPSVITDCWVYLPPLGGGTMTPDGLFHSVPFGRYSGVWIKDLDNLMWPMTLSLLPIVTPQKVLTLVSTKTKEIVTLSASSGFDSAGKLPSLNGFGQLDDSFIGPKSGVTDGSDADAGYVGEYHEVSKVVGSAVSLTTTVAANILSLDLTAGDWDIDGIMAYHAGTTTTFTSLQHGASLVSATIGNLGSYGNEAILPATTVDRAYPIPTIRVPVGTSKTVYLVAKATFAVSTLAAYGTLRARRVR